MTTEIEIKLCRVGDSYIHGGTSGNVTALSNKILFVSAEQAGVVPLLHHDKSDTGLIAHFQLHTRLSDGSQLVR